MRKRNTCEEPLCIKLWELECVDELCHGATDVEMVTTWKSAELAFAQIGQVGRVS